MSPQPSKPALARRAFLAAPALLLLPAAARAQRGPESALAALEAASGARIGFAAVDTGGGGISYRADERFIMQLVQDVAGGGGSGQRSCRVQGEFNAAIATPPGRKPILIAAFTMNGKGDAAAHQALIADIGRVVAKTFA